MSRVIQEVDIEAMRASRLFPNAVAEYDALKAQGLDPMVYLDRGMLWVGTRHVGPDPHLVPADESDGAETMRQARLRHLRPMKFSAR